LTVFTFILRQNTQSFIPEASSQKTA
jgi:hypothetical protein